MKTNYQLPLAKMIIQTHPKSTLFPSLLACWVSCMKFHSTSSDKPFSFSYII